LTEHAGPRRRDLDGFATDLDDRFAHLLRSPDLLVLLKVADE
jgi:hypothetical protein